MSLTLQPRFSDKTRAEVEAYLEVVRARRTAAAVAYHEELRRDRTKDAEYVVKKMEKYLDALAKSIDRLDKADESVMKWLASIEGLQDEYGLALQTLEPPKPIRKGKRDGVQSKSSR